MKGKSKYERTQVKPATEQGGGVVALLVFISGFSGLIYQVLWMKQLGLLFGSTSHAAAATLAAFFAGLGAGSWWWGKRVTKVERPMRLYAWLEFGIAFSALTYFVVLKIFHAIYPSLYESISGTPWLIVVKFALALLLIFPAAFFMGGTVPAIGQAAVRQPEHLGRTGALLYGLNTLGAALGVAFAAFVLIPSLGFTKTYLISLALSLGVGAVAWRLKLPDAPTPVARSKSNNNPGIVIPFSERCAIIGLSFFSGFVILALEVVWTRIFAQVHENSVYSYAIILIVVLVGLAIGSMISSLVSRFVRNSWAALGVMTLIGGALLVIGPSLLMHVTEGLTPVSSWEPWNEYVSGLFHTGFRGVGFVVIAMGTVFPFLMKLAERGEAAPGWKLGQLLAINTAGAIVGALLCGFVMLPVFGMWKTLQILTAIYLVVGLLLPMGWGRLGIIVRVISVGCLLLAFTALNPLGYPVAGGVAGTENDKVLQAWEESDGTVTVIERPDGHRVIKVNSSYGLGSTAVYLEQTHQARIPLLLFPETESICFIGLGTGISAGAALDDSFPNVKRVLTCELIPAVVEASEKWIPKEMTGGLFSDPRSAVLIEDGRHFLQASSEKFDMINADLFLPYQRGAGSLYSLDHYRVAASRLNEDGVFVQWLPMYQLTEFEFGVIARTMMEAFGEVTMWRNNFQPGQEKVALIGRLKSSPFTVLASGKQEAMAAADGLTWQEASPVMFTVAPETMPFLYAGNLTKSKKLFSSYPINTDDQPVIEYQTPKTFRKVALNDKVIWCVGPHLTAWIDRLLEKCPPETDPIWIGHPESSQHLIRAGASFHHSLVSKAMGDYTVAEKEWEIFLKERQAGAR